jgi:RNA polymerase sigma factor (sigma-70 family)
MWRITRVREVQIDLAPPWVAIEVFTPKNRSMRGFVVYDVASEDLFRDPRAFIQRLDESAAREANALAGASQLAWRSVAGVDNHELRIRWDGTEKQLASGCTLEARYRNLLKKRYGGTRSREKTKDNGKAPGADTESERLQVLFNAAVAFEEGAANFSGYLARLVEQRSTDAYGRGGRQPLLNTVEIDPEARVGDDASTDGSAAPAVGPRVDRQSLANSGSETEMLLWDCMRGLPESDRRMLELTLAGYTDSEVGEEVGCSRENVNRRRGEFIAEVKQRFQPNKRSDTTA